MRLRGLTSGGGAAGCEWTCGVGMGHCGFGKGGGEKNIAFEHGRSKPNEFVQSSERAPRVA